MFKHFYRRCAFGTARASKSFFLAIIALAVAALISIVHATHVSAKTVVIGNDAGGGLRARVGLVKVYKQQGVNLEIRGQYCLSACTMFLAIEKVCILPATRFGFHGPSSSIYGISLPAKSFEHWSMIMASHYPEPIRSWFLDRGRNRTLGFYFFTGRELIGMGIPKCQDTKTTFNLSQPKEP